MTSLKKFEMAYLQVDRWSKRKHFWVGTKREVKIRSPMMSFPPGNAFFGAHCGAMKLVPAIKD
jgi:hypothetical protein